MFWGRVFSISCLNILEREGEEPPADIPIDILPLFTADGKRKFPPLVTDDTKIFRFSHSEMILSLKSLSPVAAMAKNQPPSRSSLSNFSALF